MSMYEHIESMEEMRARVGASSARGQIEAVIAAIAQIKKASGQLDQGNRATALFHLAAALTGTQESAEAALQEAAFLAQPDFE